MKSRVLVATTFFAALALLAGCGGGDGHAATPVRTVTVTATPTPTATATAPATPRAEPVRCASVLARSEVRRLAGRPVRSPVPMYVGELAGCRWDMADRKGYFAAASLPAGQWVRNLPKVLDSLRALFEESPQGRKSLRKITRLMRQKVYRTDREGCELFRIYVHAAYPSLEEGVDTVIFYLPPEGKTQVVAGQACVAGHFRSYVYALRKGVPDRDAVADRLEDALVAATI